MGENGAAETAVCDSTPEPSGEPASFDEAVSRCRKFNNLLFYEKNVTVRIAMPIHLKDPQNKTNNQRKTKNSQALDFTNPFRSTTSSHFDQQTGVLIGYYPRYRLKLR